MSKQISRLWFFGPPVAILISLLVYYAKFGSVRHWVDTRFPWVEANIGNHLPSLEDEAQGSPTSHRIALPPASANAGETVPGSASPVAPPAPPSYFGADGRVDIAKLAADRSAWPPTVAITKAKEFPAVVNGKVVGKVQVPGGTEAKLVSIQEGKLGVEYQGGGAWLSVEETDLARRLRR